MRIIVFLAFFAFSVGYAFWKGGKPERLAALLLLAALILSLSLGAVENFANLQVWYAIVDGVLTLALLALAMAANRLWLIPLTACQLATVLGHLTKILAPDLVPLGYAFLMGFWAWPVTALLAFGTWCHRQRMKAGYSDRPWKASSRSNVREPKG